MQNSRKLCDLLTRNADYEHLIEHTFTSRDILCKVKETVRMNKQSVTRPITFFLRKRQKKMESLTPMDYRKREEIYFEETSPIVSHESERDDSSSNSLMYLVNEFLHVPILISSISCCSISSFFVFVLSISLMTALGI